MTKSFVDNNTPYEHRIFQTSTDFTLNLYQLKVDIFAFEIGNR